MTELCFLLHTWSHTCSYKKRKGKLHQRYLQVYRDKHYKMLQLQQYISVMCICKNLVVLIELPGYMLCSSLFAPGSSLKYTVLGFKVLNSSILSHHICTSLGAFKDRPNRCSPRGTSTSFRNKTIMAAADVVARLKRRNQPLGGAYVFLCADNDISIQLIISTLLIRSPLFACTVT